MSRSSAAWGVLLVSALVAASAAGATGDRARANELFRRGSVLFTKEDFAGALELLQRALRIYPSYKIEVSLGYTLERLDRPAEAARYYERFLAAPESKRETKLAAKIEAKVRRLRKTLATVSLSCRTRDALVAVDGQPVARTPLAHRLYFFPGSYRLTVSRAGQALFDESLTLRAGEHYWGIVPTPLEAVRVRPRSVDTPRRVDDARPPVYKRWWFWTLIGGVVATAVTVGVVVSRVGGSDRLPTHELGMIDMTK
jgi:tetratricopeptide (TPR) repeat protein